MCPCWMPTVARAFIAPKFCASPTAAMIRASSAALPTPSTFRQACAVGCTLVAPPTRPTGIGSSIVPVSEPSADASQLVRLV